MRDHTHLQGIRGPVIRLGLNNRMYRWDVIASRIKAGMTVQANSR